MVRDGAPCCGCGCCTLPEALGTHDDDGGDDDGLRLLHAVVARVEEAWVPCPEGADLPPLPSVGRSVVNVMLLSPTGVVASGRDGSHLGSQSL